MSEHALIESGKSLIPAAVAETLEVAPGTARQQIEGWIPDLATDEEKRQALEEAFHYRGDITLTLTDGEKLDCYLFDRRPAETLAASMVRVLPRQKLEGFAAANSAQKRSISYADIAGLAFSGRDTAAGKTWEAWVKKYWEKKMAGETGIALLPEEL